MRNSIRQDTSITQAHHCYFPLPWVAPDLVVGFAGCGIIVISSLIFNGFRSESFDLDDGDAGAFFLSITLFATTLCAEYTWFSNCLYIPNVAVQTVHLYDKCAGFNVIPWSRATWFNNFHWYTCKINIVFNYSFVACAFVIFFLSKINTLIWKKRVKKDVERVNLPCHKPDNDLHPFLYSPLLACWMWPAREIPTNVFPNPMRKEI